jgi:uncharacterized coiled-coil protein SlyX
MSNNIENKKIIAFQEKKIAEQASIISALEQEVALLTYQLNAVNNRT